MYKRLRRATPGFSQASTYSAGSPTASRPLEHRSGKKSDGPLQGRNGEIAGFAFTTTSFPNIIFFPALVAGFTLVLILHSPGRVKMPVDFTSPAPISARFPSTFP